MQINNWFIGVVEDINDPLAIGRVRVRCFEYHNGDHQELPTKNLLWMNVLLPPDSPMINSVGRAAIGLMPNSWVFGFFRDADQQDGVVLAGVPGGVTSQGSSSFSIDRMYGWGNPSGKIAPYQGDAPADTDTWLAARAYGAGMSNYAGNSVSQMSGGSWPPTQTGSVFKELPPPVPLTGTVDDVINIATREEGVSDGAASGNDNRGQCEKYWAGVGNGRNRAGEPWCAAFVSWVIQQSGLIPEEDLPKTAAAFNFLTSWAPGKDYLYAEMNPRTITKGDIVAFSWSHAGIAVEDSVDGRVRTIEGNTGDPNGSGNEVVAYKNRYVNTIVHRVKWNITRQEVVPLGQTTTRTIDPEALLAAGEAGADTSTTVPTAAETTITPV